MKIVKEVGDRELEKSLNDKYCAGGKWIWGLDKKGKICFKSTHGFSFGSKWQKLRYGVKTLSLKKMKWLVEKFEETK